jgi:hypothetical protein
MAGGIDTFFLIFAVSEYPLVNCLGHGAPALRNSFYRYLTFKQTSFDQGALVYFMQAGFAFLCAGSIRAKNVKNILLWSLRKFSLKITSCFLGLASH